MNLSAIAIVAQKELTDSFRDRRSLYTILATALLGPMLISFMFSQIAGQKRAAEEIQLPVVGQQYAPVLVNWLKQQSGVEIVPGPADPEASVRDRKAEVVLLVKKDFGEKFDQSKPAPVQVIADSTRQSSEPKVKRLTALLSRFSGETGSLRLVVRGISPQVVSTLKVEEVDVANSRQRAATILNVILMFLALAVLSAGMQIATDSTAGERERGSLEPLLLTPVPRWQLIAGKWCASAVAAFLGMMATLAITTYAMSRLSLEDLGLRFHLGRPEILLLIAAMGPLALIGPAVQTYLACFAKSFKEAQSYTVILVFAVTIPGVMSNFYNFSNKAWVNFVPVLAQYSLGGEILGGKVPSTELFAWTWTEAALLAIVFLWLASRLFSTEKIIFGR